MGVRNFMVSFYGVYFFPPLNKRAGAATDTSPLQIIDEFINKFGAV